MLDEPEGVRACPQDAQREVEIAVHFLEHQLVAVDVLVQVATDVMRRSAAWAERLP